MKEFETLQQTNPEEALKRLEELEKERALERVSLRHRNTGKWAKNQAVRAKYNKEVSQERRTVVSKSILPLLEYFSDAGLSSSLKIVVRDIFIYI